MTPKGSNELSRLQCSEFKVKFDPKEKYTMSSLSCALVRVILSNVTAMKVKIASYYLHLLLSTKNCNFQSSIFLIMPHVRQKNDRSRVLAPDLSSGPLRLPQHPVSVTPWHLKGADVVDSTVNGDTLITWFILCQMSLEMK